VRALRRRKRTSLTKWLLRSPTPASNLLLTQKKAALQGAAFLRPKGMQPFCAQKENLDENRLLGYNTKDYVWKEGGYEQAPFGNL
jgi:hypothetical protein